ncbi:MAG: hypothetical protein OEZ32_14010 [Nitrospinota bacterium]|nr:hypothetical protein [Nitrospinota bacterium]
MSEWADQTGGEGDGNSFTIYGGFGWAQMETQSEMAAEEYKRYKQYMEPYLQAGQQNLRAFNDLLAGRVDITQTPGYQAAFDSGMNALDSQLSARRQMLGGGAKKSAIQFGHELGKMQFGEEFNRRMSAAFAAPPVAYGGHPGLSTLKELNEKYKYLSPDPKPATGGGGGGGGGGDEAPPGGGESDMNDPDVLGGPHPCPDGKWWDSHKRRCVSA